MPVTIVRLDNMLLLLGVGQQHRGCQLCTCFIVAEAVHYPPAFIPGGRPLPRSHTRASGQAG